MNKLYKLSCIYSFFLCLFFVNRAIGGGVVPVYVHDFEGYSLYSDMNIQNLICQLNKNFENGGSCTTSPEYSGIRFALQGITRHAPPAGGSGLTPAAFMTAPGGGVTAGIGPGHSIHIFLYDFGGTTGVGVYLGGGGGYNNVIILKMTGFTPHTLTHEMGHAFGLAHVIPGPTGAGLASTSVSPSACTYPWSTSGVSPAPAANNFMVDGTSSGSCMFTPNQVKIMMCNYDTRWKPSASIYSSLSAAYPALITSASASAPLISISGIGANSTANFSIASGCTYGFLFYTYSIDYCGDGSTSIYDCDHCPMTGSSVVIQPCASGVITCHAHFSFGINSTSYYFDTRTPGCVVGFSCDLEPGGETSRFTNTSDIDSLSDVIVIYPTVVSDKLNIKGFTKHHNFQILDITGKLIKSGVLQTIIDVSELDAGSYFLKVDNSKENSVFRFSKF